MTVIEAQHQREIWQAKGKLACTHPESEKEHNLNGEATGFRVCTTCGDYIGEGIDRFFEEGESM